ncbi:MAG: low molecular weight protein arginine phosphatase [Candidatus Zixiibacteriota bacterium]|nr:MAG: low molecular weight protein arginine phosphatase [candidate division Zixibacteria bacterium]
MAESFKIMFVCTGNTCRSPMAEGALRKLFENDRVDGIEVSSCGTGAAASFPATDYAIEACRIWNADISRHLSQPLVKELIEKADLILTMSPAHCHRVITLDPGAAGKTFLLKNYPETGCNGEGIDDPIGGSLDIYNRTFLEIGEELGRILPHLVEAARRKGEAG